MPQKALQFAAKMRTQLGKSENRRMRRKNILPGILYGGNISAVPITLEHHKIWEAAKNEAFYSQIITIDLEGQPIRAVLKAVHRHPYLSAMYHIDFMRVQDTDVITMKVPLHFLNTDACQGVRDGGIINHHFIDVEVKCEVRFLPHFIEVSFTSSTLEGCLLSQQGK